MVTKEREKKSRVSRVRKSYIVRFTLRIGVFGLCLLAYLYKPEFFGVLQGWRFFTELSPLHILWAVWMVDMLCQLFPIGKDISIGAQKLFRAKYRPTSGPVDKQALKRYVKATTLRAYPVLLLWAMLIAAIGLLYWQGILDSNGLFMVSALFYIFDLICVLIWCPFRLMVGARCCTTCRIFNWDHMFMFTPMIFLTGFYPVSLVVMGFAVLIAWEVSFFTHPERFWEKSNEALRCSQCTDKLCTQYCQKRRKSRGGQK